MVQAVEHWKANNEDDDRIMGLAADGRFDEAINLIPRKPFVVPKPTRAQQIIWLEEARDEWLKAERQAQIYKHFVFNGKIPHSDGKIIQFSKRDELRESVFGHKRDQKRKEKAAVKLTKKEESIKEAVAVLVRMGADFDTPEGLHRDYERALSGNISPSVEVMTVSDVLCDGDPGVRYED
jgi:hypothetical protein